MQVYRGLPILTDQSPGRLVGIWPLDHEGSVGEYQQLAHAAIDEILAAGSTPVVVGGTGLYLRAALADLQLPPAPEPGARERWEELYDSEGAERAHAMLAGPTPRLPQPFTRTTGDGSCGGSSSPDCGRERERLWTDETRHPTLVFGLEVDKEVLERRIAERARAMFDAGVRQEVERALAAGISPTAQPCPRNRRRRRASRRRGRDRGDRRPRQALRRVPAQVDAPDSGPC